jgi:hypothetical protein
VVDEEPERENGGDGDQNQGEEHGFEGSHALARSLVCRFGMISQEE